MTWQIYTLFKIKKHNMVNLLNNTHYATAHTFKIGSIFQELCYYIASPHAFSFFRIVEEY